MLFDHYFLSGPFPEHILTFNYDYGLVALSWVIATFASYVSLDMASNLLIRKNVNGFERNFWQISGAIALGAGIWSMHFVGMLAVKSKHAMHHDFGLTLLSLLIAVAVSFIVFDLIKRSNLSAKIIAIASPLLGLGVAGMHYTGMAAMAVSGNGDIQLLYKPSIYTLSILVGIVASAGALLLVRIGTQSPFGKRQIFKLGAAVIMGCAICGMHYTGMAAMVMVHLHPNEDMAMTHHDSMMGFGVAAVSLLIIGIGFLSTLLNQRFMNRLEDTVKTRTADLVKAMAAKDDFLANMSHEFRTPLGAIIGHSELLEASPLDQSQRQSTIEIRQAAEHLLRGVSDILLMAKLQNSDFALQNKLFDLNDIIQSLAAFYTNAAKQKGLTFQFSTDPAIPNLLQGDSVAIQKILGIILDNAIKFTDAGTVSFDMQAQNQTADTVIIDFQVADTGIGITPTQQHNILEKFNQADNSDQRQHGGMGNGLALANALLTHMNSQLVVTDNQPAGTLIRFSITFGITSQSIQPENSNLNNMASAPNYAHLRVLLVDDNPMNNVLLRKMCQNLGITQIDEAKNGLEAIEKATAGLRYHLIFMDCQMPEMDGFEATQILRQNPVYATTPIIAVTADTIKSTIDKCLAAGMSDYYNKPIHLATMAKIFSKWAQ